MHFTTDMAQTGIHVGIHPKANPKWFQVMGERASGTNYVRKLTSMNLRMTRTEALGWKHAFPSMVAIPNDFLVICCVRNAHDWALSMHKRPWHLAPSSQAADFSSFIRAPWKGIVDRPEDFEQIHEEALPGARGQLLQFDRHPITGSAFPNLFALRRAKLTALAGMMNRHHSVVFLQMEHVTAKPDEYLRTLQSALGTPFKHDHLKKPKRRMGNNFNRSVDAPETPKAMSEEDRAFMLSELDLRLERLMGYSYEDAHSPA
ncbi:hypothetical protein ACS3SW_04720 [Roseobacteraceae bacterium S113]